MGILRAMVTKRASGIRPGFSRNSGAVANLWQSISRPVIARFIIGMASICLLVALGASLYSWHFIHTAQRAKGTVIELRADESERGSDTPYAPTFGFRDASGTEQTVLSSLYSYPPAHRVGDTVPILYLRDDPSNAKIDGFWYLWFLPTISGLLGGIYLPAGLAVLFWPRLVARFKRNESQVTAR